jgi:3-phenylpropionate/trans-cinnamate dioxygenase ferredoxin reductase subunit
MSLLHVKYLLVGGGAASYAAARAVRELDGEGSVLLVGQEINRPYHRPALSKSFLRRQSARDALYAAEPGWFDRSHVELRTGRRVSHLDVGRQTATLDNGEEVSFDRLLIATGATPLPLTVPGAHLPNLFHLRTIADVAALHHAIDKAKAEGRAHSRGRGRAVVIGAGALGVEVAASLTQLDLAVDLVAGHPHPWHKYAGEVTGRFLGLLLQRHGVAVHAPARPMRVEGDGRVQRVVLDRAAPAGAAGGRGPVLDCDFAVACVGSAANKDLLRNTPIAAGKAIIVDERCRTSAPNVWAAGDCCAVFDPLFGKHRWFDHLEHATVTGRLAGRNMAGAGEALSGVTGFASEAFGLALKVWGEAKLVDRRLLRGTPNVEGESPHFVEVGVAADGRVAQVISVGEPAEDEGLLRELVARRLKVDGNEEALRDPGTPLQSLMG